MGLLKHFRSKSRLVRRDQYDTSEPLPRLTHLPPKRNYISVLDQEDLKPILYNILTFVCPHAVDERYLPIEDCIIGHGCMLCDLRDLASCALVKRGWSGIAMFLMYRYIRIEAVHYCEREEILSEQRQHRSKHGVQADASGQRLQLLERTVRSHPALAAFVQILRLPFMTRETHKPDLARTVAVLPHLRFVDLPDGFYNGDQSCHTLRQELLIRCPDIRRMRYAAGAEPFFELLAGRGSWQHLEVLVISGLRVEAATLRHVLSCLPGLRELKLSGMSWLGDNLFTETAAIPAFPALYKLTLEDMPAITAAGLKTYLSTGNSHQNDVDNYYTQNGHGNDINNNNINHPKSVQMMLNSLTLKATGVLITQLSEILACAPALEELSVTEAVQHSLPLTPLDPLRSNSLKVFYYEITAASNFSSSINQRPTSPAAMPGPRAGLEDPTTTYYAYLNDSLHVGGFPELRELYVRDSSFADLLLVSQAPAPAFAGGGGGGAGGGFGSPGNRRTYNTLSMVNVPPINLPSINSIAPGGQTITEAARKGSTSFNHRLEVYSKGPDEPDWAFSTSIPGNDHHSHPHSHADHSNANTLLSSLHNHHFNNNNHDHHQNYFINNSNNNNFTSSSNFNNNNNTTLIPFGPATVPSAADEHHHHHHRPLSSHSTSRGLGPQWGGGAFRKSIMLGNDQGAFLAVPDDHGGSRPSSPRGPGTMSGGSFSRPSSPSGIGGGAGLLRPVTPTGGGGGGGTGGGGLLGGLHPPPHGHHGGGGSGGKGGHSRAGSRNDLWR